MYCGHSRVIKLDCLYLYFSFVHWHIRGFGRGGGPLLDFLGQPLMLFLLSLFLVQLPPVSAVTPLQADQFAWELRCHPDWQKVNFVVDGICHGFPLGFSPSQKLKSVKYNKPSSDDTSTSASGSKPGIVLAAHVWGHSWVKKNVLFRSDNDAVVHILNTRKPRECLA